MSEGSPPAWWSGRTGRRLLALALLLVLGGCLAWLRYETNRTAEGIASGNGRIEATEIDVSSKIPGRIKEILAKEGDFVRAGQVLAKMDTLGLEAQHREALAQHRRALIAVETAKSLVVQRKSEKDAAIAVVAQRKAEQIAATNRFARTEALAAKNVTSQQILDDDRARMESSNAAINAAQAQVAATEAAIGAAQSAVVTAEAAVEAAKATVERLQVDIDDSILRSPRDGRVQYRVAEPGEVVAAGGRVLNLVDLSEVYMVFFLPTEQAGRLAIGGEVRIVLDAAPRYVVPANVSYVADVAQFTPKTVETAEERQKLMFRVKARISPELLRKYIDRVKTGLPGVAYVRIDPKAEWPEAIAEVLVP